jgi:hypothetical protein
MVDVLTGALLAMPLAGLIVGAASVALHREPEPQRETFTTLMLAAFAALIAVGVLLGFFGSAGRAVWLFSISSVLLLVSSLLTFVVCTILSRRVRRRA